MSALSRAEIDAFRADLDTMLFDTCSISRKVTAADDAGGARTTYEPVSPGVSCRLHPASAVAGGGSGVGTTAGRLNDDSTHLVTLSAKADVQLEDRITVDGRIFEVLAIQSGGALEGQRHAEVKAVA